MTAVANPRCRLALCTSVLECATTIHNCFITAFIRIPEAPDCRSRFYLLTGFRDNQRKSRRTKPLTELLNAIQYP